MVADVHVVEPDSRHFFLVALAARLHSVPALERPALAAFSRASGNVSLPEGPLCLFCLTGTLHNLSTYH